MLDLAILANFPAVLLLALIRISDDESSACIVFSTPSSHYFIYSQMPLIF